MPALRRWPAERFYRTLELYSDHLEFRGNVEAALEPAQRGVAAEPLREEGHRRLMRLYAESGRRETAIRQYGDGAPAQIGKGIAWGCDQPFSVIAAGLAGRLETNDEQPIPKPIR